MPGGDGTGPMGMGAGTGRGRGGCSGAVQPGFFRRRFWNRVAPAYSNIEPTEADRQAEVSYLEGLQKNIAAQLARAKEMLGGKK